MSRSGYTDELDASALALYRATVDRAIWGKRGQAFLRELLAVLDAMPDKRLIVHDLKDESGQVCTLGSIGVARGMDVEKLDPYAHDELGDAFGIARTLVAEIEYENDEGEIFGIESPGDRWRRMRAWVAGKLVPGSEHEPHTPTAPEK